MGGGVQSPGKTCLRKINAKWKRCQVNKWGALLQNCLSDGEKICYCQAGD